MTVFNSSCDGARIDMKVVLPVQEQRKFVACIDGVKRRVSRAILSGGGGGGGRNGMYT